ncbi:hypothetical protein ACOMHN_060371 [Nucella lapillus]
MFQKRTLFSSTPHLVFVALVTVAWGQGTVTPPVKDARFQKLPVTDVLFREDVLGQKPARSLVDCGRMCARDARCLVFTFQPGAQGTPGSCRSHSTRRAAQGQQGAAPGARNYSLRKEDWIQKNCSSTSDCREPMAACFSGQCLCDGGFFFDHTENACVSNCSVGLGTTFHAYRDMVLYGHYLSFRDAQGSVTRCVSTCLADRHCTSFAHRLLGDRCYFKHATAQDFPKDWVRDASVVHYQRCCA